MFDFKGKTAVITGGAQGIGKCIAEQFKACGADVCVIDIRDNEYFKGDLADKETLESFSKKVIADFGKVDFLINNALPKMCGIDECSYEDFEYAQRAIREGVDQYLTKPITRRILQDALEEVRQKLDQEREQDDYIRRFQLERQEYEQFYRRAFLEQVFSGRISIEEIYAQSDKP